MDSFNIKDLGELKNFMGIQITRSGKGLILSQNKYALELISESGFSACKTV